MHTYNLAELPQHREEVLQDSDAGRLSLVTDLGQPVFVTVPFDDLVLNRGVRLALAVRLFDEETLSVGQAAELAGVSLAEFMETCSSLDIPVVRYSPEEFKQEMEVLNGLRRR